jgi:hypothetical protein
MHFVPSRAIARSSRWSAQAVDPDQREGHAKPNTRHEVPAPRAAGPSGRTHFCLGRHHPSALCLQEKIQL